MTDTTTIELTKQQKQQLDTLKTGSKESYKDVLQRLIENHNQEMNEVVTPREARDIATQVVAETVIPEAQR